MLKFSGRSITAFVEKACQDVKYGLGNPYMFLYMKHI